MSDFPAASSAVSDAVMWFAGHDTDGAWSIYRSEGALVRAALRITLAPGLDDHGHEAFARMVVAILNSTTPDELDEAANALDFLSSCLRDPSTDSALAADDLDPITTSIRAHRCGSRNPQ